MQSNTEQQVVYIQPDIEQVKQSLKVILVSHDLIHRKQADKYLAELEQNNPLLTLTLLEIFEMDQDFLLRFQSLILLKNIVVRQWTRSKLIDQKRLRNQILNNQPQVCINEQLKSQIKDKLASYLGLIADPKLKAELDVCIGAVAKHEFPANYPQLHNYLIQGLAQQADEIKQNAENQHIQIYQASNHMNLFKTFKGIIKEQAKKRLGHQKKQTYEFVSQIWINLFVVWDSVNKSLISQLQTILMQQVNNIQSNPQQLQNPDILFLATFSKDIDRIVATAVLSSHTDVDLYLIFNQVFISESVSKVFVQLLTKVASLLQLLPQFETFSPSLSIIVQANLKTLIHALSNIQQVYPFSIATMFNDYLSMLKIIVQAADKWQEKRLLKAAVLGFIKVEQKFIYLIQVLKCFNYYSSPSQFTKTLHSSQLKHPETIQIQENLHSLFDQFFSAECGSLLEMMIGVVGVAEGLDDEDLLEQEEDNYNEDVKSELQCPIYNLALSCIEQLFARYPQLTFQNMAILLNTLKQNNFQFHSQVLLDSVFAVVGLLPRIVKRLGMKRESLRQVVDIISILQYLSQQNSLVRLRRCAILAGRYILDVEQNEMIELVKLVLYLIAGQSDRIVQYEALMCIKTLVQGLTEEEGSQSVQWNLILEQVAPTIVALLENFQRANIVWPLLQLLQKLIQKSQYQNIESVRASFEKGNLITLMSTKSELLIGALCDMLKSLIVSFPPQAPIPYIFNMALTLIENNVDSKNIAIFKLWLFIVEEYCSDQGLDARINALFVNNYNLLLAERDLANMVVIIFLIEEHVLMQTLPYNEFGHVVQLVEERLNIANLIEGHDEALQIKNACLNLVSTIVLIILNNKRYEDLGLFKAIIVLILQDFLGAQNERQLTHILIYKTQSVSILNRFIIQDFASFQALLQSYNIQFDQYFQFWIKNMSYISSRISRKINMISLMIAISHVSTQSFLQNLEAILRESFPEVHQYLEMKDPDAQNNHKSKIMRIKTNDARLSDFRSSERKELLRLTQLYDEVNVLEFFQQKIKGAFEIHQLNEDVIRQFLNDQQQFDKLITVLNTPSQQNS